MPSKSRTTRPASFRRLRGFETLESRQMLSGTPGPDGDTNDQICEPVAVLGDGETSAAAVGGPLGIFDVDLFEISISSGLLGKEITFTANATSGSTLDPFLRLFDGAGNPIAENDDRSFFDTNSLIEFTFTSSGIYYLGVSTTSNEDYSAVTGEGDTFSGDSTAGPFEITFEDTNDQIDEASTALLDGASRNNTIAPNTDVDVFRFDVIEGQTFRFEADGDAVSGGGGLDTFLYLFDDDGDLLASDDDGGDGLRDSEITFTFPDTDDYYVAVSSFGNPAFDEEDGTGFDVEDGTGDSEGNTTGRYDLFATEVSLDPNDRVSNAIDLGNLFTQGTLESSGTIDNERDVDLFEFVVGRDGSYVEIDIDRPALGVDSFIRLFRADGTVVDSNDDANAPGESGAAARDSFIGQFLEQGTYYLGVSAFLNRGYDLFTGLGDTLGSSTGSYSIQIQDRLHVDTNADGLLSANDDENTLREAIEFANEEPGSQTVTFQPSAFSLPQTITLSGQPLQADTLVITDSLEINGPGANLLTISGSNESRVFIINSDRNNSDRNQEDDGIIRDVTLRDLSVADGFVGEGFGLLAGIGGGIFSTENLILDGVSVRDNLVEDNIPVEGGPGGSFFGQGGGLFQRHGQLTVEASTFSGNTGSASAAISALDGLIFNSTFSGNSGSTFGGGFGGTISNSTFANGDFVERGGGPRVFDLFNSIVERSTGPRRVTDDHNLVGANLLLGPLQDNGGPTLTHALLSGSLAVNQGSNALARSFTDQRGAGFARFKFGTVDIGAVESDFDAEDRSLVVTITNDLIDIYDNETSLREAITFANDSTTGLFGLGDADNDGRSNDTITFDPGLANQRFSLDSGLTISSSLTIDGLGADRHVISGNSVGRVFNINDDDGANLVDVTLQGIEIRNGGNGIDGVQGAGIRNTENLMLSNVTVDSNLSDTASGGGIFHAEGSLKVFESTISNNGGRNGGGLFVESGDALIINSTISGNEAFGNGGGVDAQGEVTIINSTITGNTADVDRDDEGDAGGVAGSAVLRNTIIAGNFRGVLSTSNPNDVESSVFAPGSFNNLIGTANGVPSGNNGNIIGNNGVGTIPITTILDRTLADNGGETKTHALVAGSLAIDAGANILAVDELGLQLASDQNNAARIIDGDNDGTATVDIGAVETVFLPIGPSADFDNDGDVDEADYLLWQSGFGTASPVRANGDANLDGRVDAADYTLWRNQLGSFSGGNLVAASLIASSEAQQSQAQAAAAPRAVSTAPLSALDAAIATMWPDMETEDDAVLPQETLLGERVAAGESTSTSNFTTPHRAPAPGAVAKFSELEPQPEEDSELAWLTDELLQRVFWLVAVGEGNFLLL